MPNSSRPPRPFTVPSNPKPGSPGWLEQRRANIEQTVQNRKAAEQRYFDVDRHRPRSLPAGTVESGGGGGAPGSGDNALGMLHLIGDLHYGAVSASRPQQILDDLPLRPAAHLQVGDLTDDGTAEQDTDALAFLNSLPAPWYAACGDHDTLLDARTTAQWAAAYGMAGQNWTIDLSFCRVISLAADTSASKPTLTATTISYLDTQLAGTTRPCLILCHYPLYNTVRTADPTTYYDSVQNFFYAQEPAALWTVLSTQSNAVAWISGHTHSPASEGDLVKQVRVGTRSMAAINCSSPYYTDKVLGEAAGDPVVSLYLTLYQQRAVVQVRNHTSRAFAGSYTVSLETGLGEVTPLLNDDCTTDDAAPIASPRISEPGPGGLHLADASNVMSLAGGVLAVSGTPTSGSGFFGQQMLARKAGRAFFISVPTRTTIPANTLRLGLSKLRTGSAVCEIGVQYSSTTTIGVRDNAQVNIRSSTLSATGTHRLGFVMRGVGGLVLANDDTMSGQYQLEWVYAFGTDALLAKLQLAGNAVNFTLDDLDVYDLGGSFASDYGVALGRTAVTAAGDTLVGAVDGLFEHTITAQTGVTQEFMYRRTDDNNCWIVRMDQGGSTQKLISKAAGVETERDSDAFTWTNGTQYRVVVVVRGTSHAVYVGVEGANEALVSGVTSAAVPSGTGLKVSHAGENLVAWPKLVTVP